MAQKKEKDILLDHEYDGIRELDNDLPPWWLWLFYFTIIWSVLYLLHYHVFGTGDSQAVEYMKELDPEWSASTEKAGFSIGYRSPFYETSDDLTPLKRVQLTLAMKKEEAIRLAEQGYTGGAQINLEDIGFDEIILAAMSAASPADMEKLQAAFPDIHSRYQTEGVGSGETSVVKKTDPEVELQPLTEAADLSAGESLFATNCVPCHGKLGEGGIGPNMTDTYFIHGHTMNDVVRTINNGVPAKGMISWRTVLKPDQIKQVASYILTLIGTNPPNAKGSQGDKVEI